MLVSLQPLVDVLAPAFSAPSAATNAMLLLSWVMCLRHKSLLRVGDSARPDTPPDRSRRHRLDTAYNFFERSAWTPDGLARRVGLLILTRLRFTGCVTLLVDDTLLHKAGKCVWGLGWFRDAVASTRKRVATAPGHNWVVLAVAFCNPLTGSPVLALPLLARLHRPGKHHPSCPALVRAMLDRVLEWYPDRHFTLVGDGAYAAGALLTGLPGRVRFVGRMRGDAAVYDPRVPAAPRGRRGRKATKGPRLPGPKEAAAKADRTRSASGSWAWRKREVCVYGKTRTLWAVRYLAVWPRVLGLRPVRVVVVRDPSGRMDDTYLFTTDLDAASEWVVEQFARRWSIEVLFRSSKQTLDVEAPQHWCRASVEKVAPWVWSMQSVIMVWYVTAGRELPEAVAARQRMGPWDSEWSLRNMVQVMRSAILNATFDTNSTNAPEWADMVQTLKNWGNMAA
jgi:hypothetical protein